jgi:hypothetical protein
MNSGSALSQFAVAHAATTNNSHSAIIKSHALAVHIALPSTLR